MEYDIFVSHCHKDKLKYVDDLVEELKKLDIKVFYDTDEITWGDDIREKIDNGLKNSKLAIVVISRKYFGRDWTEYEIKELFKRQFSEGRKLILPILYQINKSDLVEKHYPFLKEINPSFLAHFRKDGKAGRPCFILKHIPRRKLRKSRAHRQRAKTDQRRQHDAYDPSLMETLVHTALLPLFCFCFVTYLLKLPLNFARPTT